MLKPLRSSFGRMEISANSKTKSCSQPKISRNIGQFTSQRRLTIMKKRELKWIVLVVAALTLVIGDGVIAGNTEVVSIATGGSGGKYYPLGRALAQAITGKGISGTVQTGNASVANCNLIASGKADTAFVQNN